MRTEKPSRAASCLSRLIKTAATADAKAEKPRELTMADINKAKLNPELMRRVRLVSSAPVPLRGDDLLALRRLARANISLMRQRDKELTEQALYDRLRKLMESRRPEVREAMMAAIREQYGS